MKAPVWLCIAVPCLLGPAPIVSAQMSPPIIAGAVSQYYALESHSANCQSKDMKTKTIKLTAKDNGREVRVDVGAVICVELETQGGTGYSWHVDQLDPGLLKPAGSWTKEISRDGAVGGPVTGVWRFEAVAPGVTRLRMLYYRTWEGKGHAIKTFEVRLDITGK